VIVGSLVRAGLAATRLLPGPPLLRLEPLALLPLRYAGPLPLFPRAVVFTEAGPEALQRDLLVPVLAPLVPCRDHDPGGTVGQAYPALGGVLVLPALSARPEGVDPTLRKESGVVVRDVRAARGGHVRGHARGRVVRTGRVGTKSAESGLLLFASCLDTICTPGPCGSSGAVVEGADSGPIHAVPAGVAGAWILRPHLRRLVTSGGIGERTGEGWGASGVGLPWRSGNLHGNRRGKASRQCTSRIRGGGDE
jgi:hypothetical protein